MLLVALILAAVAFTLASLLAAGAVVAVLVLRRARKQLAGLGGGPAAMFSGFTPPE